MGGELTHLLIRPLLAEDVEAAAALDAAHQSSPWSEAVFHDELVAENRIYLAAYGEELLGYAGAMVVGDEAHVTTLMVAPGSRRRGIGRRLMVELAKRAISAGSRHLTLEVRARNTAARELYSAFDLAPVGVRKGYYTDDDALILWAHDIDEPDYIERLDELT